MRCTQPEGSAAPLEPTTAESRASQSAATTAGQRRMMFQEQISPVILDHQHDRPLIDAEVIRNDQPTNRSGYPARQTID